MINFIALLRPLPCVAFFAAAPSPGPANDVVARATGVPVWREMQAKGLRVRLLKECHTIIVYYYKFFYKLVHFIVANIMHGNRTLGSFLTIICSNNRCSNQLH